MRNRIWNINFDTLKDFENLTHALVRSNLIDLKSAKIQRIEVNEKKKCSKCNQQSDYEIVLTYKGKFFSQFVCYSCSISAIADYFNSLFKHLITKSFELKQDNYTIKNTPKSKKALIKILEEKDLDYNDFYDETITFTENVNHLKTTYPGIFETADSHANFNLIKT